MSDLSEEVRVQVARLRHLLIDVGRRGIFSSPLAAPPDAELEPLVRGIRMARRLAQSSTLRRFPLREEIAPGADLTVG